ncbi:cytochrome c family protein [Phenylobacterium zucineum HLK1]|uniref:Cytochrome c family protein n=1 Tax=Phenylobacterium zucineum (strain HLK1) TaxID=450851 RepID=B4RD96_PHEZH|nr:c-type cytochrome [Phenylobacterium zucineum]ACG76700.1 cytochrome c family protein [Phenylobacterium zucineum HLK1]
MSRAALALPALVLAAAALAAPASAADGQQLFNMQCKMCHTGGPMGPSLAGVAGAKIASKDFAYSPALKAKEGTWTPANLDAFLKAPTAFAPGTKMMISVPDDESRAAIVDYLKTLK